MAVDYAKLLQTLKDDPEEHDKLRVFLKNEMHWEAAFTETVLIFVTLMVLVMFSRRVFEQFYETSGRLMDLIALNASKKYTI